MCMDVFIISHREPPPTPFNIDYVAHLKYTLNSSIKFITDLAQEISGNI